MNEAETNLPVEILGKAVLAGREYGWRPEDVISAIEAAPEVGLAVTGGQVQFRFQDGTCELYWMNYDSSGHREGESWSTFTERSAKEVLGALEMVMENDLVKEGVENFEFLKSKGEIGEDIEKHLVFIVYFQTKNEAEQLAGENAPRPTA